MESTVYCSVVMIGDGTTDLEACPPAVSCYIFCGRAAIVYVSFYVHYQDAFIGYGGNVVRQKVKEGSTWFVTDFQELIDVLATG